MNEKKSLLSYLACPYAHEDARIMRARLLAVTKLTQQLICQGIHIYSPLTHNAPLIDLGIKQDWLTWKPFDHEMLSRCDRLLIFKLTGWEKSKGVAAEIECAKAHGLVIEEIEDTDRIFEAMLQKSCEHSLQDIQKKILAAYDARDWAQFHSPKNLVMNLVIEASEIMEHFRWLTEKQSYEISGIELDRVRDEIGDTFIQLVHLCHYLNIDPVEAALQKLKKIEKAYPIEQCKGKSLKYTAYQEAN